MLGLSLMGSPASATTGDSGRIDTSAKKVETQPSALTRGGNDNDCTGDKCERINWCVGNEKPGDKPRTIAADAPVVRYTDKGDKGTRPCIKYPVIDYKCCVPDKVGTADVVVKATNPNRKGDYKVRVQIGEQVKEAWIEAGKSVKLTFTGLGNGEYEVKAAVWAGKGVWCAFKPCPIKVKCAKPIPTSPSPSVSTSTPSNPPTSTSPSASTSTSPSASTSTSPVPGGGGGDSDEELALTGASTGWVAGGAAVLLIAGAGLFFLARRRRVNFTA